MARRWFQSVFDVRREEGRKIFLLWVNLYLIVTAYYVLKPLRGALFLSEFGADRLPYVWILTAIAAAGFVIVYGRLVDRFPRRTIFGVTTIFFITCLLILHDFLLRKVAGFSAVFYIWVDLFSVVMVEHFWSFSNDIFETSDAKRLYGVIGSGGLAGGISGSALATFLVPHVMAPNLIYFSIGILLFQFVINIVIDNRYEGTGGLVTEGEPASKPARVGLNGNGDSPILSGFRLVLRHPYLTTIFICVVLTQVTSNIIDYSFNTVVENTYLTLESRTVFLGQFFMWLNVVSLVLMLLFTGPIYRYLGVAIALLMLPLANLFVMSLSIIFPLPILLICLKLVDKSLRFSVYRVSKELLYIPTSREVKYKAKAVIDMFGFRLGKIISAVIVLPFVVYLSWQQLSFLGLGLLIAVVCVTLVLGKQYQSVSNGMAWEG